MGRAKKPVGWRQEHARHVAAGRGIKTFRKLPVHRFKGPNGLGPPHVFAFPWIDKVDKTWDDGLQQALKQSGISSIWKLPSAYEDIDLDAKNLYTGQQGVFVDQLKPLMKTDYELDYYNPDDPIVVVRFRGKNVVFEGNHRLAAMKLLGKHSANVEVFDADVVK